MMKKLYLLFFLFISISVFAQDIHFSQTYNAPLWLNPALTGFTPGKARIGVNYRSQWFSATGDGFFKAPFMTTAISADVPIAIKHDALGVGLFIANDQQGANTFTGVQVQASVSYIKTLGRNQNHRLSAGLQIGYTHYGIKTDNFQFANQFQDNQFVNTIPSNEMFTKNSAGYFDMNAGLFWYGKFVEKLGSYLGASFYNVSMPKFDIIQGQKRDLYWRWCVQGGLDVIIASKYHILPSAIFTRQAVNDQFNSGLAFGYDFNRNTGVTLGVYNRISNLPQGVTGDAVIPYAGFSISGFKLGLSYDATVSKLKSAGGAVGAFELYLSYTIPKRDYNYRYALICPRF